MILLRFLNWLFGYIIIDVRSGFTERFINLLSGIDIPTWGIKQLPDKSVRIRLRARKFKKIRHIAFKTKVRIKIVKKKGLPFYVFRYRKRHGFIAGAVIFLALLIVPTFFIWKIDVVGEKTITEAAILESVAKDGIKVGMSNLSVHRDDAQLTLLKDFDGIIWTHISVKGSKLVIEVKEGVEKPEIISEAQICNIVAKKDGLITTLNVLEGTRMVNRGDTVSKGDLIVSGIVDSPNDGLRYVHAMAEVQADTVTVLSAAVPLEIEENVPNGRVYKRFYLQFLNNSVKLYIIDKIKYDSYEITEYENFLSIKDRFYFPVGIKKEIIKETNIQKTSFSEENAKKAALIMLTEKEHLAFNSIEIKDRQVTVEIKDNAAVAIGTYVCSEDIAEKVILK